MITSNVHNLYTVYISYFDKAYSIYNEECPRTKIVFCFVIDLYKATLNSIVACCLWFRLAAYVFRHHLSPQGLALEVSSTGTVLSGSLSLHVPGQQLHQVVGGAITAFALHRLSRAHREEKS